MTVRFISTIQELSCLLPSIKMLIAFPNTDVPHCLRFRSLSNYRLSLFNSLHREANHRIILFIQKGLKQSDGGKFDDYRFDVCRVIRLLPPSPVSLIIIAWANLYW